MANIVTISISRVILDPVCYLGGSVVKTMSQYGLDLLNHEEDQEICFGVNIATKLGATGLNMKNNSLIEDSPMGIVVRNVAFNDISPMMVPLKKMKYLDVDIYVPNNPIAYLEKEFEQGNDVGRTS